MIGRLTPHVGQRAWTIAGVVGLAVVFELVGPGPGDCDDGAAIERVIGPGSPLVGAESFGWVWPERVENSGSLEWHPAVFLGRIAPDEPRDLYVADFRVTADGRPREGRRLTNLSRSADGDEGVVASAGDGKGDSHP